MSIVDDPRRHRFDAQPWFASLPQAVRDAVFARARLRRYAAGERLFSRGDAPDGWYGLLSGSLRASGTTSEGEETVLTFAEPGTWIGDMSMIDGAPRSHDVHAHEPSEVARVSAADFRALLDAHPALTRGLLERRVGTVRLLMSMFEGALTHSLERRFAVRVLMLVRAFGGPAPEGVRIELRLSQEVLARMMGVSRPRINQVVRDWQARGLVEQHYGRVTVIDVPGLVALARGTAPERDPADGGIPSAL